MGKIEETQSMKARNILELIEEIFKVIVKRRVKMKKDLKIDTLKEDIEEKGEGNQHYIKILEMIKMKGVGVDQQKTEDLGIERAENLKIMTH